MKRIMLITLQLACMFAALAQKPGSIDSTFGNNGSVTDSVITAFATGVVQANQKIIAASNSWPDPGTSRYLKNGSRDKTYGKNGIVSNTIGCIDLAVQPDGKLVILSQAFANGGQFFLLARYLKDGTPDSSFGQQGIVKPVKGKYDDETPARLALQADGSILACGTFGINTFGENFDTYFGLRRYTKNGKPDYAFGDSGSVSYAFTKIDRCTSVLVQQDGKIVLGGKYYDLGNRDRFALIRYTSSGTVDSSFGTKGTVTNAFNNGGEYLEALALQQDGKLVAGGMYKNSSKEYMCAARYNADGSVDKSFGTLGFVSVDIPAAYSRANNVLVQENGKIVLTGLCQPVKYDPQKTQTYCLVRLNTKGALDNTFGNAGKVAGLDYINSFAGGSKLQADGKILVFGNYTPFDSFDSYGLIVRYNGDAVATVNTNNSAVAVDALKALAIPVVISPNPVKDEMMINTGSLSSKTIIVTNASGKVVLKDVFTGKQKTINVSRLTAGMYYVKIIESNGSNSSVKIVKQ